MYTKTFIALLISICFASCMPEGSQQKMPQTSSEISGISTVKLSRIDSLVSQYVSENKFPGGVFLVARRGKIVYYKNLGNRSLDTGKPYQKDDIFRIASMTKAVTAVAAMQLYEQGRLGLDDPVSKYIPAFDKAHVLDKFNPRDSAYTSFPAGGKITIRHLLTHTSGLGYGKSQAGDLFAAYAKLGFHGGSGLSHPYWTTEELANRIARLPLAFHPGDRYLYGLNMDVLGRVIEVVSGMTLSDYFEQNIFTPLGMSDTHFYLPEDKYDRLVPVHDYVEDQMVMYRENDELKVSRDYPEFKNARAYFGGGGLSSTTLDYAKFLQSLLSTTKGRENYADADNLIQNDHHLLGHKTLALMVSDQFVRLNALSKGMNRKVGVSHGLGVALTTATGTDPKSPGSYEWGGSFSSKFFVDPEEELIFVGMSQAIPRYHQEFYGRVTAIIYGAIND